MKNTKVKSKRLQEWEEILVLRKLQIKLLHAVELTTGRLTYFGSAEEVVPLYDAVLLREEVHNG